MYVRTILMFLVMFLVCASLQAADDPVMGTWKLNVAKSKFDPGPPQTKNIRKHEPLPNGVKVISDVDVQGEHQHFEFTATFDGKYYPIVGSKQRDEVSFKRIDAYTIESINRKKGKVTTIGRWMVSKDGKTLTSTVKGTFPDGQHVDNIHFYEKQ